MYLSIKMVSFAAFFILSVFCTCHGFNFEPEDHVSELDIDLTNEVYTISFEELDELIERKNKMVQEFTTKMGQKGNTYFGVFSKDVSCEGKPTSSEAMMVIKKLKKIFNGAITDEMIKSAKQSIKIFTENNKSKKKCKVGIKVNFKSH